jgi:protein ImuB
MALSLHPEVAATVVEWAGGRSGATQFGDIDARVIDLTDSAAARQRVSEGQGAARQWSGALPRPLPATVFTSALKVQLLDQEQRSVFVTGRHELSASPVFVIIDAPHRATAHMLKPGIFTVTSWVGPWPVEERWWDPRRRRRLARLQVVIDTEPSTHIDPARNEIVLLLCAEKREWSLTALYE